MTTDIQRRQVPEIPPTAPGVLDAIADATAQLSLKLARQDATRLWNKILDALSDEPDMGNLAREVRELADASHPKTTPPEFLVRRHQNRIAALQLDALNDLANALNDLAKREVRP